MISIRKMKETDRAEVLSMMRVFFDSPAVLHTAPDEILERNINDCIGDMPFVEGFILEDGGTIAGYSVIAKGYTTEYGGLCIWIEDIYIKPEYRRRGLASALFHYLETRYEEAVRFKMETEPDNTAALKAYKRNGYQVSPYYILTKEVDA